MKLLVCVKQTLDTRASFDTQRNDGILRQVELEPVYRINPPDRCALELATWMRQSQPGVVITAVTAGSARADDVLAHCLAVGVDRVIRIDIPEEPAVDAFTIARELCSIANEIKPDLILCGTATSDENSGVVGPALAEFLDVPQVTGAVRVELKGNHILAQRRLERGARELVECEFPCLLAVEPTLNEPRYVSLRRLYHARKKPIEVRGLSKFAPAPEACLMQTVAIGPPRPRPKWISQAESSLSPTERLKAMMMGGAKAKKKSDDFVEGKTDEIVDRIVKYLEAEGVLSSK